MLIAHYSSAQGEGNKRMTQQRPGHTLPSSGDCSGQGSSAHLHSPVSRNIPHGGACRGEDKLTATAMLTGVVL